MSRRPLPPALVAARRARAAGDDPLKAEAAAVIEMQEAHERDLMEKDLETFWQGPDTFANPPKMLQPDTEEGRYERTPLTTPEARAHMSREMQPIKRESKVFRLRQAQRICTLISQGQTLQQICGVDGLPSITIINIWLQDNERFRRMMDKARILQADYLADEMLLLASKVRGDPRNANAYKVAADILRWQASVRNVRKYGDKTQIEVREVHKSPAQIQKEIIDLAAEFNVPIANLPNKVDLLPATLPIQQPVPVAREDN